MKIVAFTTSSSTTIRPGALLDEQTVLDLSHDAARLPARTNDLDACDLAHPFLAAANSLVAKASETSERNRLDQAGALIRRSDVSLKAPIPRPGKIICIGLNYRDHAEEQGAELPTAPLVFSKYSNCVLAPGGTIIIPPGSTETDFEAELGVVIGKHASRVTKADAMNHVLGYCNFHDVSARDFQFADGQWTRGKACDTFAPFGEFIATTDEIPDPHKLRIQLRLNGKTMQDSNTNQLLFDIPTLVEYLSNYITLEPGDIIATGTPPGVGFARKPPIYLAHGDVAEVEIEGLGILTNNVIDANVT